MMMKLCAHEIAIARWKMPYNSWHWNQIDQKYSVNDKRSYANKSSDGLFTDIWLLWNTIRSVLYNGGHFFTKVKSNCLLILPEFYMTIYIMNETNV